MSWAAFNTKQDKTQEPNDAEGINTHSVKQPQVQPVTHIYMSCLETMHIQFIVRMLIRYAREHKERGYGTPQFTIHSRSLKYHQR